MTTPPVRVERRVGQRFPYLLPVSLGRSAGCRAGQGFTQDLSARGVFFFTDAPLEVGAEIELTLRMPSEITLGENMPVRCRGRVLRVVRPAGSAEELSSAGRAETKIGVAVRFEGYEYLTEMAESSVRAAALHPQREEERRAVGARAVV
jgi:hypothetical protein